MTILLILLEIPGVAAEKVEPIPFENLDKTLKQKLLRAGNRGNRSSSEQAKNLYEKIPYVSRTDSAKIYEFLDGKDASHIKPYSADKTNLKADNKLWEDSSLNSQRGAKTMTSKEIAQIHESNNMHNLKDATIVGVSGGLSAARSTMVFETRLGDPCWPKTLAKGAQDTAIAVFQSSATASATVEGMRTVKTVKELESIVTQ